jgi:DNA adenine methylase
MQHLGGKFRIVKPLAAVLQLFVDQRGSYVEPFVGGASVIAKIKAPERIASDANRALITMWSSACRGWVPPSEVSEATFAQHKANPDPSDPMTAFCGFGCSFGAKWFGGFARNSRGSNYAASSARSIARKVVTLTGVQWHAGDYRDVPTPAGSVIYCDPPYEGTTGYSGVKGGFDHTAFWQWCREKTRSRHLVFVSEYAAPSDFLCIWSIEAKTDLRTRGGREPRVEKLFMYWEGLT